MTPEEKAKELFDKMYEHQPNLTVWNEDYDKVGETKQCALIAVGEILDCLRQYPGMHDQEFIDSDIAYYVSVKTEIEKL